MRKVLLAFALGLSLSGFAQVLKVGTIEKVALPENPMNQVAAISPQGDFILVSTNTNQGLTKFDLTTHESTRITDAAGAGFDAMISADGRHVVYRENNYSDRHLRMVSLKSHDLVSHKAELLVEPTRDLQGYEIQGATAAVVDGGKLRARAMGGGTALVTRPVLSIKNRQLMITENGETRLFSPNGTNTSYVWASLSPDGTKVVYYVAANGTYVCDLNGQNRVKVGTMRAPQWYGNNVIIGMMDQDDGEFIYASTIVAADLKGNSQTLTGDDVVAMYPYGSADGHKIVFSTPAGEAYIINLK